MPNRILREGYLDSEKIRRAGEAAEVLFARLVLVADDFGRFDGRLTVICRRCWPNGGPGEPEVAARLDALIREELVEHYEVEGKAFICIPNFKQRTRASRSKFPDPPLRMSDKRRSSVRPMSGNGQSDVGHMTAETYSYSETYSDAYSKSNISSSNPARQEVIHRPGLETDPTANRWADVSQTGPENGR